MLKENVNNKKGSGGNVLNDRNFLLVLSVSLMSVMGVASISPVFPEIARVLNVSGQKIGLLITVFTLPGMVLAPVLGILADNIGRKKILVPSLLLFGAAGGMCGFVREFELLLILRFIQGIGMSALGVLNVTIISDLYTDDKLNRAMGYNTAMVSVGAAGYPAIGGLLALGGWYYPFMLAFLGIPAGLLVWIFLESPETTSKRNIKEYLKNAVKSILQRQIIAVYFLSFLTFFVLYGLILIYYPLFLKRTFHFSPFEIGLTMSVFSVTTAVTSSQLGRLLKIFSKRILLIITYSAYALSFLFIPFVTSIPMLIIPVLLYGIGNGLNIPTLITILAGLSPGEYRALSMSVSGMVLRTGQTTGPIIMGVIFASFGIGWTFFSASFLAVIMLATAFVFRKV